MSFDERLKKIAPILNYKNPKLIKNILVDEGIEDETILDASTTTEDDLVEILMTLGGTKKLKAKKLPSTLSALRRLMKSILRTQRRLPLLKRQQMKLSLSIQPC